MGYNEDDDYEVWENAGKGRVAIQKLDQRGLKRTEIVAGGRKFHVTPRERRMNQELVALESMDVFINGTLRPVRMIEGTEDAKEIASNPNHLSESDMVTLLKSHYKTFDDRLESITNIGTVERLLELAETDEVGATVRTVSRLRDRLAALNPTQVMETTHVAMSNDAMIGGIKAVTPR